MRKQNSVQGDSTLLLKRTGDSHRNLLVSYGEVLLVGQPWQPSVLVSKPAQNQAAEHSLHWHLIKRIKVEPATAGCESLRFFALWRFCQVNRIKKPFGLVEHLFKCSKSS